MGTFGRTADNFGTAAVAIIAADFNNDGKLDLAVLNSAILGFNKVGYGSVTLLLGNGDGTFTQASGSPHAVGQGPYALATADFNGDGRLDLAVDNLSAGTASILLRQ